MKRVICLVFAVITITIFHSVRADEAREKEPRLKGVELYSWKNSERDWVYVLADGTNRQKTEQEIKKEHQLIRGTAELKRAIAKLEDEEQVHWSDHFLIGFEFPPEETRTEILMAANEANVELTIDLDSPIEPTLIENKVMLEVGEEFECKFMRDGNQLLQPTKVSLVDAETESVHFRLDTTQHSPSPPPREGAMRSFLSIDNNFDRTLSFRVLVRMKDLNNPHQAAFMRLSNEAMLLPAGEVMNKCWAFDELVEKVVIYDLKLLGK